MVKYNRSPTNAFGRVVGIDLFHRLLGQMERGFVFDKPKQPSIHYYKAGYQNQYGNNMDDNSGIKGDHFQSLQESNKPTLQNNYVDHSKTS